MTGVQTCALPILKERNFDYGDPKKNQKKVIVDMIDINFEGNQIILYRASSEQDYVNKTNEKDGYNYFYIDKNGYAVVDAYKLNYLLGCEANNNKRVVSGINVDEQDKEKNLIGDITKVYFQHVGNPITYSDNPESIPEWTTLEKGINKLATYTDRKSVV